MKVLSEKKLRDAVYKGKTGELKPLAKEKEEPKQPLIDIAALVKSVDSSVQLGSIALEAILEVLEQLKAEREKQIVINQPAKSEVMGWDFEVISTRHDGGLEKLRARKLIKKTK